MTNKTSKRIAALAAIALTACRPLASTAQTAEADTLPPARPGWTYTARLGLNIGGTAPIGMPATIRRMNDYDLQPNFTLGIDAEHPLRGNWGVLTGIHIDNKGMNVDATVKNYHTVMTKGGDELEGYYTGRLVTKVEESMVTIPLQATYHPGSRWRLRLGSNMRRLGMGIGAGADWQFGHRWGAYADLQWGVTGVHERSFKTIEQTLYPIFGTLGVTYKLR